MGSLSTLRWSSLSAFSMLVQIELEFGHSGFASKFLLYCQMCSCYRSNMYVDISFPLLSQTWKVLSI